jgi:predicted enzyme related to lactoylglutathione lyase
MPNTVVHFEIPADDVERLSKFYADNFGWKFQKQDMPGMTYWLISTGPQGKSVGGGMYKKQGPDFPRNFLRVKGIDRVIQRFQQTGGTIFMPKQDVPGIGATAIGKDPEGNPVGLFEPMQAPRKAAPRRPKVRKAKRRR